MVLMVLNVFSRLDFLLFCFRRRENQNLENQTRFFSLLRTTELALVSLNLTRRNLDLFRHFSFSFLLALVSRPHLHARKPPPITPQELEQEVATCTVAHMVGWGGRMGGACSVNIRTNCVFYSAYYRTAEIRQFGRFGHRTAAKDE